MQNKNKNQSNLFATEHQLVSYCPLCNKSFLPQEVSVINTTNTVKLLHISCTRCSTALVVLMLTEDRGMSSVGFLTDLSEADVLRLSGSPPVSADDVLAVHTGYH